MRPRGGQNKQVVAMQSGLDCITIGFLAVGSQNQDSNQVAIHLITENYKWGNGIVSEVFRTADEQLESLFQSANVEMVQGFESIIPSSLQLQNQAIIQVHVLTCIIQVAVQ